MNEKGYAPSVREICRDLGIKSTSSAQGYLEKLANKGYIDRENGYIGMGVTSYGYNYGQKKRYVIFKFENEKLDVAYEFLYDGDTNKVRGTYIDEYIYVLSQYKLKVIAESELK